MSGKIYLIQSDNTLQALSQQPYANEDLFQSLLEQYPDLLAGEQIDEANPRRWLLVAREVGVPGEEGGGNQWSLDHLFLDQDAVPTLVEVKRASDTCIRREVVGQMLDYAANAVVYWPVETIRARFEATCDTRGAEPAQEILNLLGASPDDNEAVEAFWGQVKTNLQAAKIRMVFVADAIPPELRRIVEFLNAHMDPVEVLAVEIKQYVGEGLRTLVPRVVGQTAQAQGKKTTAVRESRQWDQTSFLEDLSRRHGADAAQVAAKTLAWARSRGLRLWWGKGDKDGSCFPMFDYQREQYWLVSLWTYGRCEVQFQMMASKPPFADEAKRLELLDRFNQIPGLNLPQDGIHRRPSFPLALLKDEPALNQFLEVLDWMIALIRETSRSAGANDERSMQHDS
jgi:hypothetical protein